MRQTVIQVTPQQKSSLPTTDIFWDERSLTFLVHKQRKILAMNILIRVLPGLGYPALRLTAGWSVPASIRMAGSMRIGI